MTLDDAHLSEFAQLVAGRLELSGYRRAREGGVSRRSDVILLEDQLTLVVVASFRSDRALLDEWALLQDEVAAEISRRSAHSLGAKAWDSYLVLLVPMRIPAESEREIALVRANTRQFRKLVLVGSELGSLEAQLAPLLPLELARYGDAVLDPLAELPARLAQRGVPEHDATVVREAHLAGRGMLEALLIQPFGGGVDR